MLAGRCLAACRSRPRCGDGSGWLEVARCGSRRLGPRLRGRCGRTRRRRDACIAATLGSGIAPCGSGWLSMVVVAVSVVHVTFFLSLQRSFDRCGWEETRTGDPVRLYGGVGFSFCCLVRRLYRKRSIKVVCYGKRSVRTGSPSRVLSVGGMALLWNGIK